MRVFITGAGGQLGQDMVKFCKTNRIEYVSFDSKALDITKIGEVRHHITANRPDVIINCAAYNAVDSAETEWKKAFLVNGIGVKNLVLSANAIGAVMVHYSSDYIFDGDSDRPYTIGDHPNPLSRYGESKLLGEQMIENLSQSYFLIRTSWVFGQGNTNFPQKILEWSKNQKQMKVVIDQVSSPTYTVDLVKATFDLLKTQFFGKYHITNADSCSRFTWAEYILSKIGWKGTLLPAKSSEFNTAAKRPSYSVLDNFGTAETIGYQLPHWKDATDRFLEELELI